MSNIDTAKDVLKNIAIGEARGATSLTSYGFAFAKLVSEGVFSDADTATVYLDRFGWVNAERATLGKEPIKIPSGKSYDGQVSKFRRFQYLGTYAKNRPELLTIASDAASTQGSNYKATLNGVGKMNTLLAVDAATDSATLLGEACAAMESLEKPAEKAIASFDKVLKAVEKFSDEHGPVLAEIAASRPAARGDLTAMLSKFATLVGAAQYALEARGE